MRNILVLGLIAASAATTPALAISRYDTTSYTCAQTQTIIAREGAVILNYKSNQSKMTLYDRFVADRDGCDAGYSADRSYISTKDTASCPVKTCMPSTNCNSPNK
jgi:hypothetical protein